MSQQQDSMSSLYQEQSGLIDEISHNVNAMRKLGMNEHETGRDLIRRGHMLLGTEALEPEWWDSVQDWIRDCNDHWSELKLFVSERNLH